MNVLFVVGPGRSGSTLLANVLGEMPDVVAAGEVRWLFRRGVLDGRLCGCRRTAEDCEVWRPVVDALGALAPAERVLAWQHEVAALRHRYRLLKGRTRGWEALRRYVAVMRAVYEELGRATGARWVVDASKRPQDLAVALEALGDDHVAVVHLVRDPRSVAESWTRPKPQPDRPDGGRMGRNPPVKSALRWMEINLGAEVLHGAHRDLRWSEIRYEDLTADPKATFGRIVDLMGEDPAELPFVGERTVALRTNHTVAGNPDRFTTGEVRIRPSSGPGDRAPAWHRALVSVLTAPVAPRYDYPVVP